MNKIDFKESVYEAMLKSFFRFLDDLDNDFYNFRLNYKLEDTENHVCDKDIIKALSNDLDKEFINDLLYSPVPNNIDATIKLLGLLKEYYIKKNKVKLTPEQIKNLADKFVMEKIDDNDDDIGLGVKTYNKLMNYLYEYDKNLTPSEISSIKDEVIESINRKQFKQKETLDNFTFRKPSSNETKNLASENKLYDETKKLKEENTTKPKTYIDDDLINLIIWFI